MSDKEMVPVNKSLGEILSSLRREAGYTQSKVSRLLAGEGVDIQTAGISKWEKGLTLPNAAQFLALCKIYGVTDVLETFTGRCHPARKLNAEGRRLIMEYTRVLIASGLYAAEPEKDEACIRPVEIAPESDPRVFGEVPGHS